MILKKSADDLKHVQFPNMQSAKAGKPMQSLSRCSNIIILI